MKLLEFALQQEKPTAGMPGFVALWVHIEGLQQYAAFKCQTTTDNHEGIYQAALAIRSTHPMTMPNHFTPLYNKETQ